MITVDLNCDMGEGFGAYTIGQDEALMPYITSVNIACGFHAGDPGMMRKTVLLALEHGVSIGAHPGLPDLPGFGRRSMDITPREACDMVVYQIGALSAIVSSEGGRMAHVKPHGALYNMAASSYSLAEAIAEGIYRVNPELILYGLAGSELIKAGAKAGLRVASEVFADRTYQGDGSLTPRQLPNSLITDRDAAVSQVIMMVKEGRVLTSQQKEYPITADTICIHGDGAHALDFAKHIRQALSAEGIRVRAVGASDGQAANEGRDA